MRLRSRADDGGVKRGDLTYSFPSGHSLPPSTPGLPLLTFVSIIRNLAQVNEVGADGHVVDLVRVSDLHLHAFAEWGEEVCKDDLLIPQGLIAALLH